MIRHIVAIAKFVCWTLLLATTAAIAQQPATGVPPLSSFAGGPFDSVNLANLNAHFTIPVFSKAGKGIPFEYALSYDSLVWEPVSPDGANLWTPVNSNWGWRAATEAATGYVTYTDFNWVQSCKTGQFTYGKSTTTYYGFTYHDPNGGIHPFGGTVSVVVITSSSCGTVGTTVYPITNAITWDNSGYIVSTNSSSALGAVTVNARGGLRIVTPGVGQSIGSGSITDANGNNVQINYNSSTKVTTITDTLTTTALTISGNPPSPTSCTPAVTYTYTAPAGQAAVTVSYRYYIVQTNFLVQDIQEFSATGECLVDRVTLPDQSYYQFAYEVTVGSGISGKVTGRIASVTLPTGGTISYSYVGSTCGNNSNCIMADGSPSNITRTVGSGTWTYDRTPNPSLPQTWTSITDPAGNITDIYSSGVYQTAKSVYQGARIANLDYSYTCYNNNSSGCPTATVTAPISSRTVYDYPNYGSFYAYSSYAYDTYGNLTSEADYNYATTNNPKLKTTTIVYNSTLCSSYQICSAPQSVEIDNGSGQKQAYTSYGYDERSSPTHGSITTISRWASTAATLSQLYSYNSGGGTLATATDPNGTVTSYNYSGSICNGAFPTSAVVNGITTSYTYNCTGAW